MAAWHVSTITNSSLYLQRPMISQLFAYKELYVNNILDSNRMSRIDGRDRPLESVNLTKSTINYTVKLQMEMTTHLCQICRAIDTNQHKTTEVKHYLFFSCI